MSGAAGREPIVQLENLTRDYGCGPLAVAALRGVDLTITSGEFAALAGPSGSGKTTLLHLVAGLDRPTSGRVRVAGAEVTAMSGAELSNLRLRRIGFVFQSYSLIPVLTAYENAEYVLALQGVPRRERRERVMADLRTVGLAGLENRFPGALSGGQQQRVAVARAIAHRPALVLADEPTANLDSVTAGGLLDLMAALNRDEGITFLFSTHDRELMRRAGRLIRLRDGLVDRCGTAES
jgi:putative ABC transport system ATP-binding protein